MMYGVVSEDQASEATLRVCKTSKSDDFEDGVHISPSNYVTSWSRAACDEGRTLPVYDDDVGADSTGVVFRNPNADAPAFDVAPPTAKGRGRTLMAVLAAVAAGGAIAATLLRRRR